MTARPSPLSSAQRPRTAIQSSSQRFERISAQRDAPAQASLGATNIRSPRAQRFGCLRPCERRAVAISGWLTARKPTSERFVRVNKRCRGTHEQPPPPPLLHWLHASIVRVSRRIHICALLVWLITSARRWPPHHCDVGPLSLAVSVSVPQPFRIDCVPLPLVAPPTSPFESSCVCCPALAHHPPALGHIWSIIGSVCAQCSRGRRR